MTTTHWRLPFWLRARRPIAAVNALIGRLHVATKIPAVDSTVLPTPAQVNAFDFGSHRLTELVGQNEGRLVLHVQVAREGQRALCL